MSQRCSGAVVEFRLRSLAMTGVISGDLPSSRLSVAARTFRPRVVKS